MSRVKAPSLSRGEAHQLLLRGLVIFGSVVAVLASGIGGPLPPVWLVAVVALLGLGFAYAPESATGTLLLLVILGWWGLGGPETVTPGLLVGVTGLVVTHVAGLVAAFGSRDLELDAGLVRIWALRAGMLLIVAPVVWIVAAALEGQPEPPGIWLLGGLASLLAIVAASSGFDLFQGRRVE